MSSNETKEKGELYDGFSVSLKGEQTFPPRIFRILSVDVEDPYKEINIEIKTDESK